MATIVHLVTTPDTGNTPNTSGAFSPAVDDLLFVVVTKEASALASPMVSADLTSSVAPTAFTSIRNQGHQSSAAHMGAFVATALATNTTSRTVTIAGGADAGAGTIISVYAIRGMTKVDLAAILQSAGQTDQAAGTPAPAFGAAAQTANAVFGAIYNATNPAGLTQPSGWTESQDTGYTTGQVSGLHTCFRNSGETGTTITWGSASASAFASIIVEFDTSSTINENASPVVAVASVVAPTVMLSQAGVPVTTVGGVAAPTSTLNYAAAPVTTRATLLGEGWFTPRWWKRVTVLRRHGISGRRSRSRYIRTIRLIPLVGDTVSIAAPTTQLNHAASPVTTLGVVITPTTSGGDITENAVPVTTLASVVTAATTLNQAAAAVGAVASVTAVTLTLNYAANPVGAVAAVVAPATALNYAANVTGAAASVATPTITVAPVPGAIAAVAAVVTPATTLNQAAAAVGAASSVVAPTPTLNQVAAAVSATAAVAAPSTTLNYGAAPVVTLGIVPAPSTDGAIFETPSPVVVTAAVVAPATSLAHAASPVQAIASVPSVATALNYGASPVITVVAVGPVTTVIVSLAAQRIIIPPARVRAPTLIPAVRTITPPARVRAPTITENRAMYTCSNKAPGSVEKFTWNWTPLLVGAETVSSYSVAVEAGTVVKDSDSRTGAVVTAFISGGTIGESARVRCRATLSSGRQLDVSFYFLVRVLFTRIDTKDPDDIDDFTINWARHMNTGATVSTFAAFSDAGGCVIGITSNTTTTGSARVSAGTEGATADVRGRITTSDLETLDWTMRFPIRDI